MKKENLLRYYQIYKMYIFPAVVALSSLFLIIFVIYPQTAKLISNQTKISDLTGKLELLETKVSALESYDEKDLSKKLELALAVFPAEKDLGRVFSLLQETVLRSGFTVTGMSLSGNSQKTENTDSLGVKLEMSGDRALFQTLLRNLENTSSLIRVKSIDVVSARSVTGLDVLLLVDVLYSVLPQDFGKIDSPLPSLSQKDEELLVNLVKVSARPSLFASGSSTLQFSQRGKANPFE